MANQMNTPEDMAEMLQQELEAALQNYTDDSVHMNGTQELVIWNGAGFEVNLSNGASFQLQIVQTGFADEDNDELDVEELLMLDPEDSWDPVAAEEAQQELADAVEAYGVEGDHGPSAEGLAREIDAIAQSLAGYFDEPTVRHYAS